MINDAKSRIWARMQDKLPDRGVGLLKSSNLEIPRLQKVQMKERLLDSLPDFAPSLSYSEKFSMLFKQKAAFSMLILSVFFVFVLAPTPNVSASSTNILEVTQGTAVIIRGTEQISVRDQSLVVQGDKIEIANDSMAHLYFVDDSQMTLGPGTVLAVTEVYVNPGNKARTEVVVDQFSGRAWTQVLNIVGKDSFFSHRFPDGEISVRQRASFDVDVGVDSSTIEVARNLVDVMINEGNQVYTGTLGQGVKMETGMIVTSELTDEEKNDVWWKFNLAFEKSYARTVEEKYKQEAIARVLILPGNPLYKLKTFQERVQSFVTLSKSGRQELAVKRAETRLSEARALIAKGDSENVAETLIEYQEAVTEAVELSGGEQILADTEEVQKQVLTAQNFDESTELLKSTVNLAAAESSDDLDNMLLSASQRLSMVPDLIDNGNYDLAMQYLENYKDESRAILVELESVPLEERQTVIMKLLDQKLGDLQLLRILAVDVNAQTLQEMSMIILSLRERELNHLSDFFAASSDDKDVQMMIYSKLKNSIDIDANLLQGLDQVEAQLSGSGLVVDLTVNDAPVDPRLNSHSDEAQNQTNGSEKRSNDPKTHNDL